MMNNIIEKKFPRSFIFSLYFLQSLGFESTYLPNPNRGANHYAINLWCFNIHLKHTRTSFVTSDIFDVW